eukprot:4104279-Alexandrium_andersonii.AAC.1
MDVFNYTIRKLVRNLAKHSVIQKFGVSEDSPRALRVQVEDSARGDSQRHPLSERQCPLRGLGASGRRELAAGGWRPPAADLPCTTNRIVPFTPKDSEATDCTMRIDGNRPKGLQCSRPTRAGRPRRQCWPLPRLTAPAGAAGTQPGAARSMILTCACGHSGTPRAFKCPEIPAVPTLQAPLQRFCYSQQVVVNFWPESFRSDHPQPSVRDNQAKVVSR